MQREFSIFFLTASIRDFPPSITVTSQGEAGQRLAVLMGRYQLDQTRAAMLRPVYSKTDGDYYIYYTSKGRVQKFMLGKLVDFSIKWAGPLRKMMLEKRVKSGWIGGV